MAQLPVSPPNLEKLEEKKKDDDVLGNKQTKGGPDDEKACDDIKVEQADCKLCDGGIIVPRKVNFERWPDCSWCEQPHGGICRMQEIFMKVSGEIRSSCHRKIVANDDKIRGLENHIADYRRMVNRLNEELRDAQKRLKEYYNFKEQADRDIVKARENEDEALQAAFTAFVGGCRRELGKTEMIWRRDLKPGNPTMIKFIQSGLDCIRIQEKEEHQGGDVQAHQPHHGDNDPQHNGDNDNDPQRRKSPHHGGNNKNSRRHGGPQDYRNAVVRSAADAPDDLNKKFEIDSWRARNVKTWHSRHRGDRLAPPRDTFYDNNGPQLRSISLSRFGGPDFKIGVVSVWNAAGAVGKIRKRGSGQEFFVHVSDIICWDNDGRCCDNGWRLLHLMLGNVVSFRMDTDTQGPRAREISLWARERGWFVPTEWVCNDCYGND